MFDEPIVFQENKPLSQVSTFGIGGPARYFVEVRQIEEMQQVLKKCRNEKLPYIVIGKGSNCLFDDRGFNGLLILNKIDFMKTPEPGIFHAGAGYSFSLLGVQTARQGWSGLEFASGIPGSVGGAVYMNAGANGGETAHSLLSVDYVTDNGDLVTLKKEELEFSYRTSSFHKMQGAIVGATFALIQEADARKKQLAIVDYRKKTQPYGEKSAGCVFRNPAHTSAGALIDSQGLKGMRFGNAIVSHTHANFIVNEGGTSSDDVKKLIAAIRAEIFSKTGISLESEIRVIPFSLEDDETLSR